MRAFNIQDSARKVFKSGTGGVTYTGKIQVELKVYSFKMNIYNAINEMGVKEDFEATKPSIPKDIKELLSGIFNARENKLKLL